LAILPAVSGCDDSPSNTTADAATDGVASGNRDASMMPSPDGGPLSAPNCADAGSLPCPPPEYATWPMPNPQSLPLPNPGGFTVTDKTATDRITGLQWQRTHTEKRDWQNAVDTCATLSLEGYDDWRLPSRIELISTIDYTRQPTTDNSAFADTALDYFWSSSTVSYDPMLAYSVYYGAGLTAYGRKSGASAHVRCVRGGRPGVVPRYTISADEVGDRNTGLVWQRRVPAETLSFATANLLCNESTMGGHSDWRLPSLKEMQTIVEERFANPMVDPVVFPDTPRGRYWTGSAADASGSTNAVYLEVGDGTTEHAATGEPFFVRCVR
jgi:Protein of unknown function (DUF1566)